MEHLTAIEWARRNRKVKNGQRVDAYAVSPDEPGQHYALFREDQTVSFAEIHTWPVIDAELVKTPKSKPKPLQPATTGWAL